MRRVGAGAAQRVPEVRRLIVAAAAQEHEAVHTVVADLRNLPRVARKVEQPVSVCAAGEGVCGRKPAERVVVESGAVVFVAPRPFQAARPGGEVLPLGVGRQRLSVKRRVGPRVVRTDPSDRLVKIGGKRPAVPPVFEKIGAVGRDIAAGGEKVQIHAVGHGIFVHIQVGDLDPPRAVVARAVALHNAV